MPLPRGLPVVDHHCHLSPSGDGVRAAERFRAAGGTHLFVATQNYGPNVPRSVEEYRRQFETTEALAKRVGDETSVVAYSVLAPYPVDLIAAERLLGLEAAVELQEQALDLAGRWIRERRAVALGEVGRPHFEVPEAIRGAATRVFRHALEVARDVGCPVVVHSADLDEAGLRELAAEAASAGVAPAKVVKHYARAPIGPSSSSGIARSYLARRETVHGVLHEPAPWFLETDYLDDPARPGAVLDLATVPRRAKQIAEAPGGSPDRLWVPFSESIEKVYGWRPEVDAGGAP